MKKITLILFVIISVGSLKAQDSPQGSTTPSDPFPGVVTIQNYWNMRGNTASFTTGSELGTKNAYPLYFMTNDTVRMTIDTVGNIGIGTYNPQAKLAVNGEILAKSVRVNTNSEYWPDYVFSPDYELMRLDELENYITDNKHLPGIISATEVDKQGDVDLGEMNVKLLEKIEELTLYIIDLQKQIDELKNRKE